MLARLQYIKRFLETGVGQIGVGRHLRAVRADGEAFEMFLTLTEIKESDAHYFCGFIKNLASTGAGSASDLVASSSDRGSSPDGSRRSLSGSTVADSDAGSSQAGSRQASQSGSASTSAQLLPGFATAATTAATPLKSSGLSAEPLPWHEAAHETSQHGSSYWTEIGSSPGEQRGASGDSASSSSSMLSMSSELREIDSAELRFLSTEALGKGAFGVVFAAEWRGVRVAVKKLMGYVDDQMRENLRAECALMHKCSNHPNIVKFIGACVHDRSMCIVSQYCSNGSWFDALITRKQRFAPRNTVRMLRDAALGIIHLHKESIVHRDIAARNVLLDEHFGVYVSDFGLARVKTQAYHHTKSSLGPVKYLSPEAIAKKQYSFASDVFSFGVLIWEVTHVAEPYDEEGIETFEIAIGVVNGTLRLRVDDEKALGLGDLMRATWRAPTAERPKMEELLAALNAAVDAFEPNRTHV